MVNRTVKMNTTIGNNTTQYTYGNIYVVDSVTADPWIAAGLAVLVTGVVDTTTLSAVSSGAGVPAVTPTKVGDIYVDNTRKVAYMGVGVGSASDYAPIFAGSGATVTVAASDATALSKRRADYVCTGTNDDVVINAARAAVVKGTVLLSEGTFNLTNKIDGARGVNFVGMNRYSTILNQTLTNKKIFDMTASHFSMISNLCLKMPAAYAESAVYFDSQGFTARDILVCGGGSSGWVFRGDCLCDMGIYDVDYDVTNGGYNGNGILLSNDGGTFNAGNGKISNLSLSLAANTIGIKIIGNAGTGRIYNLMLLDAINIVAPGDNLPPNGCTGIWLERAAFNTFTQIDLENLDTGVYMVRASNNVFVNPYFYNCTKDVQTIDSMCYANTFIGGTTAKITDYNWAEMANLSQRNNYAFISDYLPGMTQGAVEFQDDFVGKTLDGRWNAVPSANGGVVAQSNTIVTLSTGSNALNVSSLNFNGIRGYGNLGSLYFETKASRVNANGYNTFFGIVDGGFLAANHGAFFSHTDANAHWIVNMANGSAITSVTTSVVADIAYHTFAFYETPESVNFYIDGVIVATINTGMTNNTAREPMFSVANSTGTWNPFRVDLVRIKQGKLLAAGL